MSNPANTNTQTPYIPLTEDELYPKLPFETPIKYINQDQKLWYGFYIMMQRLLDEKYIELSYIPDIEEMFGQVPEDEKFKWMYHYEMGLAQNALYGAIGQADVKQEHTNQYIDDIFALIPDDRKVEFLELLFEGNIPPELASQIEYTPETVNPEDVMARYRENGLTLGSGDRSTFSNNNRVAMTTEQLAGLLDKMSGINQELKSQIQDQPVISTASSSTENPFMKFGDKVSRVIDSGRPGQIAQTQTAFVATTNATPSPTGPNAQSSVGISAPINPRPQGGHPLIKGELGQLQRTNQNLVNQAAPQTRNQTPGQPFTLPSIQPSSSTISRLTQARRANTVVVAATTASPLPIPPHINSQSTAVPIPQLQPTQPNSTAQMLKAAIQAKKQAEAIQSQNQPKRPTVSL